MPHLEGEDTFCRACRKRVIGRRGYAIVEWNLKENGLCRFCGAALPGVFEARPGHWGNRRLPVSMKDRTEDRTSALEA